MDSNFKDETIIRRIKIEEVSSKKIPSLHILSGPAMGKLIPLKEGEVTVGRNEKSDIAIPDEAISRFHCKFTIKENKVTVEDLKSANGTYVNGDKIEKVPLKSGDKVKISSESLIRFDYIDKSDSESLNRLYDMAVTDGLTEAHTKRYFTDQMIIEFSYAKRRNSALSLILFDLDHFKKINDEFGHVAGDYVLRKVAETTKLVIRKEDLFARYGGEEFAILMRDTPLKDALRLAERLRLIVEESDFMFEERKIPTTISVGVACFQDGNLEDFEDFIKEADEFLYLSKKNGRNKVTTKT